MKQHNNKVIDSKALAIDNIKELASRITQLKKKKIIPHIAVIAVGSDSQLTTESKQIQKAAEKAHMGFSLHHFKQAPNYQTLSQKIHALSLDKQIHGITILKPVPSSLSANDLSRCVAIAKDIDGTLIKSTYTPPIAAAVFKILNSVYFRGITKASQPKDPYSKLLVKWLKSKEIVLIGRGETGGGLIAETFKKLHIPFIIAHSQTSNLAEYSLKADIIISAVGKPNIIKDSLIKPNVILIGVGMKKTDKGIVGDYETKNISEKALFYTLSPQTVEGVHLACLLENTVTACIIQQRRIIKPVKIISTPRPTTQRHISHFTSSVWRRKSS